MPRSLLDPITPIGSLTDGQPTPQYFQVVNSSTTSATMPTVGFGGLMVYGMDMQSNFIAPDGTDVNPDGAEPHEEAFLKTQGDLKDPKKAAQVTAEFYFEYLKTHMTRTQQAELKARVTDLTATLKLAPFDQKVLREETQRLLAVALLQQKAAVLGYDQVVSEDDINQFRGKVEMKRPELMRLSNFPRIMPAKAVRALDKAKKANLFDEFLVLTWNPQQEQVLAVTDRIVKKDPILFGRFAFDEFYYYYITSWEDETCDLTFDKMIASLKELHPDYEPATVVPLTAKDANILIKAAQARSALLKDTNVGRYRSDALAQSLESEEFSFGTCIKLLKALTAQFAASRRRKALKKHQV
jgi:hypothetical protein